MRTRKGTSVRAVKLALKMSKGQLYQEIGLEWVDDYSIRESVRFKRNEEFYLNKGRRIFQNSKKKLFKAICEDFKWCKKSHQISEMNPVTYFGLLSPYIIPSIPAYVSVSIVFALLVKYGLNKFCNCKR